MRKGGRSGGWAGGRWAAGRLRHEMIVNSPLSVTCWLDMRRLIRRYCFCAIFPFCAFLLRQLVPECRNTLYVVTIIVVYVVCLLAQTLVSHYMRSG